MAMEDETPNTGPWANDLRAVLGEEHAEAFDALDGYLREKWQPRVTELEEGTKDARELWKDLNEDAPSTIAALVSHVYGDDFTQQYMGLFDGDDEETPEVETPEVETPEAGEDEIPAWAKPIYEQYLAEQEAEQAKQRDDDFTALKRSLVEKHESLSDDDIELIDPFIYSSPDDLDKAVEAYGAWKARFGGSSEETPETPEAPEPPPVLGGPGGAAATPPVEQQYKSYGDLDAALTDFLAENRTTKTPPPVVG